MEEREGKLYLKRIPGGNAISGGEGARRNTEVGGERSRFLAVLARQGVPDPQLGTCCHLLLL